MNQDQAKQYLTLFAPAAVTAAATASSRIDTLGSDYATISVAVSLGATATIASSDGVTISVLHSDNTNASTFVTLAANKTAIKTSENAYYTVDTRAAKRYLRVTCSPGTSGVTNEHATVAILGTLGKLEKKPDSTGDMLVGTTVTLPASNTNDVVTLIV